MAKFDRRIFLGLALVLFSPSALVAPVGAQERTQKQEDTIAIHLGLTKERGSLPLWEKPSLPALEQLSREARSHSRAVFQVGHPDVGSGTAFCVSTKARLLVTNAHVADMAAKTGGSLWAVMNETGYQYKVARILYHPGVVRKNTNGQRALGEDHSFGPVEAHAPDLAIFQLTEDGPALPEAFGLASPKEVEDLFASPIGMIGFPGYNTKGWPKPGEKPAATFQEGVVCRVTDFEHNPAVSPSRLRFLQHNLQSWPGTSGSPLFRGDGKIIGIQNSLRAVASDVEGVTLTALIPHGIRVDCLWELLVQEELIQHVKGKPEGLVAEMYQKGFILDLALELAIALHNEGLIILLFTDEPTRFRDAAKLANEAIRLAPGYWRGYALLGSAWNHYACDLSRRSGWTPEFIQYIERSQEMEKEALRRAPGRVDLYAGVLHNTVTLARYRGDRAAIEDVVATTGRLLKDSLDPEDAAWVWDTQGTAFRFLDRYVEAVECFTRAIEFNPEWSEGCFMSRASVYEKLGNTVAAARDRAKAAELRRARAAELRRQKSQKK